MDIYILVIDYDNNDFEAALREWREHGVQIIVVHSIMAAIRELVEPGNYLFAAVFSKEHDFFSHLQILRLIRPTTLIIFSPDHDIPNRTKDFFSNKDKALDTYFETEPQRNVTINANDLVFGVEISVLPTKTYIHKDLVLIAESRKLFVNTKEINLARADFDMLELLISHKGRVFTYEQLYNCAYGDEATTESMTNSVHCHIKRIRQKIRPDKNMPGYIDSVRGIGYRMSI